jgi:hypothetical protein
MLNKRSKSAPESWRRRNLETLETFTRPRAGLCRPADKTMRSEKAGIVAVQRGQCQREGQREVGQLPFAIKLRL